MLSVLKKLPCDLQNYICDMMRDEDHKLAIQIALSKITSDPSYELTKWDTISKLITPTRFLVKYAKRTRDMLYQFSERFLVDDLWFEDFDAFESFLLTDFFPSARSISLHKK